MATSITKYSHCDRVLVNDGDWAANTIKLALVASTYTPSAAHTVWADVSSDEVATGNGYTTGGESLTGKSSTNSTLTADDVVWTALNKTVHYAVLYISGTVLSLTNPLLAYIQLDTTPADVVVVDKDFTISWSGGAVFNLY